MKLFAIFALFAVVACASAGLLEYPQKVVRLEDVDTASGIQGNSETVLSRERRFTCDLFSFESGVVTPNDAACAAKCIALGSKGGHCENKMCICREDKWVG